MTKHRFAVLPASRDDWVNKLRRRVETLVGDVKGNRGPDLRELFFGSEDELLLYLGVSMYFRTIIFPLGFD